VSIPPILKTPKNKGSTIEIGQDFTKLVVVNLFPHIDIPRKTYLTTIEYTTNTGGIITMHHMSYLSDYRGFIATIGIDVFSIKVSTHERSTSQVNNYLEYSLRVDQLILLNLASNFFLKKE